MPKSKLLSVACLAFTTLFVATSFADTAPVRPLMLEGKGTIKGKVLNAKGEPAVGCPVKIYAAINNDGGGRNGAKSTGFHFNEPILLQGKMTVLAQAVADAKGEFEVKMQLDAGSYRYMAGNRSFGVAAGTVTVEANKQAVIDIKLNASAPR